MIQHQSAWWPANRPTPAVAADGAGRKFGTATAVEGLTLSIEQGEVFGLVGPRGAGKTTAIRMLAGVLPPSEGRIAIGGLDATDPAGSRRIKSLTGFLPEGSGQDPEMSVAQLQHYFSRLQRVLGGEHTARIDAILATLRLWDAEPEGAPGHPKEMGQRLAMARALAHNPSIVFFDEPTAHLTRGAAETVHGFIADLRTQGCTVVLTTREFTEAEQLCDRVAVMNTRVLAVDSPRELRGTLPVGI